MLSDEFYLDINILNSDKLTPLQALIEMKDDNKTVCLMAKRLLEHGASVTFDGLCALRLAVKHKMLRLTKLLLSFGPDINGCGDDGNPPLVLAVGFNARDIFELLLKHPALNEESVSKALEYCAKFSNKNPMLGYYAKPLEIRNSQPFLNQENRRWVRNMQVVFGSKDPQKSVLVPSTENQFRLFMRNEYTQNILSKTT